MRRPRHWLLTPILLAALLFAARGLSPARADDQQLRNVLRAPGAPSQTLPLQILQGPSAPSLGTAESFAVLAGSTATNTGDTVINGHLGVSPGSEVTGFPPGIVNGTRYEADAVAAQAQVDLGLAYDDLAGRACDPSGNLTGQDLGGLTLTSGVYCFDTSAQLTGLLTLDAKGDSGAVFVLKIGSTLTTASSSSVQMIGNGNPCNVYWQVGSSATLGTDTAFSGNILALTSITLNTGADITGSALARNGAVTMDTNTISLCSPLAPTPTTTSTVTPTVPTALTPTTTTTVTPTATTTVTPTATTTVTPTATTTVTPTATSTVTPTATSTVTPTATTTVTPTVTTTATPRPTGAPTATPMPAQAPTSTPATGLAPTPTLAPLLVGLPVTGGAVAQRGERPFALLPFGVALAQPSSSAPLVDPNLDLRAGPVDVPLELWIPSLDISAPVLAVGITSKNVMDAPMGRSNDPVWHTAFWYRGGGIPGDPGTATIAGHVDGLGGQPALFAHLGDLRPGDLIIVYNTESDLGAHFIVTEMEEFSARQAAADPSVLVRIYGIGPVSGRGPQPAQDGLSHLTLITCSGDIIRGSYEHRLVVYAQRVEATPQESTDEIGGVAGEYQLD